MDRFKLLGVVSRISNVQLREELIDKGCVLVSDGAKAHKHIGPECLDVGLQQGIGLKRVRFLSDEASWKKSNLKLCNACCFSEPNCRLHFDELSQEGVEIYTGKRMKKLPPQVKLSKLAQRGRGRGRGRGAKTQVKEEPDDSSPRKRLRFKEGVVKQEPHEQAQDPVRVKQEPNVEAQDPVRTIVAQATVPSQATGSASYSYVVATQASVKQEKKVSADEKKRSSDLRGHHLFALGQRVQRRDSGREWGVGYVKSLHPLEVTAKDDPSANGYEWDEVRHMPKDAEVKKRPAASTFLGRTIARGRGRGKGRGAKEVDSSQKTLAFSTRSQKPAAVVPAAGGAPDNTADDSDVEVIAVKECNSGAAAAPSDGVMGVDVE